MTLVLTLKQVKLVLLDPNSVLPQPTKLVAGAHRTLLSKPEVEVLTGGVKTVSKGLRKGDDLLLS